MKKISITRETLDRFLNNMELMYIEQSMDIIISTRTREGGSVDNEKALPIKELHLSWPTGVNEDGDVQRKTGEIRIVESPNPRLEIRDQEKTAPGEKSLKGKNGKVQRDKNGAVIKVPCINHLAYPIPDNIAKKAIDLVFGKGTYDAGK